MTEVFEEESWENEISAALSNLGLVEPPPGFLERAVDHRPLFATRVTVGLLALAGLALVGAAAGGLLAPAEVVPELAALTAQHELATSKGLQGESPDSPDVDLPDEFDHQGTVSKSEDLEQSLYMAEGSSFSVFTQPGDVDFSRLPADGLLASDEAWISEDIVVLESKDDAVTIIGLPKEALNEVLAALTNGGDNAWDRVTQVMGGLTTQLGFEDSR